MIVSRVRATGTTDGYGDTIAGTRSTSVIHGAWVWPRTSDDATGPGRDGAVIGLALWVPPGYDLRSTDEIDVHGERWRIVGDAGPAAEYESPFTGWNPGSVVALERVEG